MLQLPGAFRAPTTDLGPGGRTVLVSALALGVGCLIAAGAGSAAEATGEMLARKFPVVQIFTFLFLMLGPFKIIGPFSAITKGSDARIMRQVAVRATVFASLALLIAAFLGETILSKYGIPVPVLALSAGIILLLVALKSILEQFSPPTPQSDEVGAPDSDPARGVKLALTPLAFPTIVTPYGIAALVVFLALSPDMETQLTIGVIVLAIMALNLIVMIAIRYILPIMALALPILAAVLGVVQVALGLQIINNSLKALGVM
jgi:multiple antibiotic resistance protein